VLAHRVGDTFSAVAVEVNTTGGKVQLLDPTVLAGAHGRLELGERLRVRLAEADPETGLVRFEIGDRLG